MDTNVKYSIDYGNLTMSSWNNETNLQTSATPFCTDASNIFNSDDSVCPGGVHVSQNSNVTFDFSHMLDSSPFQSPSESPTVSLSTNESIESPSQSITTVSMDTCKSCSGRLIVELCPTQLTVNGFKLTINHKKLNSLGGDFGKGSDNCPNISNDETAYIHCLYYCSLRRGKSKCQFKLTTHTLGSDYTDVNRKSMGVHTCGQDNKAVVSSSGTYNYAHEMEAKALEYQNVIGPAESTTRIAEKVYKEYQKLSEGSLCNLATIERMKVVLKTARCASNKDALLMYQQPMIQCHQDARNFLQFDQRFTRNSQRSNCDGELARVTGYADPGLIAQVWGGPVDLFADATFRVVPSDYYQLFILMAYLRRWNMFVPIWYVLMSHKEFEVYDRGLDGIVRSARGTSAFQKLEADSVMTDFELAEMKACEINFKPKMKLGCTFHFKQANSKQLRKLGVHEDIVWHIMAPYDAESEVGLLEMLTFIDPTEIESKAIPYLKK